MCRVLVEGEKQMKTFQIVIIVLLLPISTFFMGIWIHNANLWYDKYQTKKVEAELSNQLQITDRFLKESILKEQLERKSIEELSRKLEKDYEKIKKEVKELEKGNQ